MRSVADRLRHAVVFELIALSLILSLGMLMFDISLQNIGVLAIISSLIAMCWVYIYNQLFDRALLRFQGHLNKTFKHRIIHAVVFEAGLLLVLLPFIAWYLQISLLKAFLLDVSLSAFYIVYALGYNWVYDWVFPVKPENKPETSQSH